MYVCDCGHTRYVYIYIYSRIYELQSKLLVSPFVTIVVPKIIPHITIFKELKLWLIRGLRFRVVLGGRVSVVRVQGLWLTI